MAPWDESPFWGRDAMRGNSRGRKMGGLHGAVPMVQFVKPLGSSRAEVSCFSQMFELRTKLCKHFTKGYCKFEAGCCDLCCFVCLYMRSCAI